jgi:hypothetical protein
VYEAVMVLPEWPEAVVQPRASNLSVSIKRRVSAERAADAPTANLPDALAEEQPCLHLMVATEREGFIDSVMGLRFANAGALPPALGFQSRPAARARAVV